MFVSLLAFLVFLSASLNQLVNAKSSFDLSSLKQRQHRHSHVRHIQRDLLGLGDPLGLFPPSSPASAAASPSQTPASTQQQQASHPNSNPSKPAVTPAPSSNDNGGLLGIPGLSLPDVGVGAGGGILPSITLGVGNQNTPPPAQTDNDPSGSNPKPTSSSGGGGLGLGGGGGILPSITLGVGNQPAPSPSPTPTPGPSTSPSSSSGSGISISIPGVSLSIPPIGGGGDSDSDGASSQSGATPSSSGGGGISLPLPSISLSIPPILPTPSSSAGGSGSVSSSDGGIGPPTLSIPPIGGSPTSSAGNGSPSSSSPPIISISVPSVSLPVTIPPIGSSSPSGGNGASSSTVIGVPSITIPPIGSSSDNGGKPTSSAGNSGVIPSVSISISVPLPTGSSSPPERPPSSSGGPTDSDSSPPPSSTPAHPRPDPSSSIPVASANSSDTLSRSTMTFSSTAFESSSTLESTTTIGSQFSFITATSLEITSIPTTTPTGTQTDPDVATSTIAVPSSNAPQSSPTLPADLPEMILPSPPLDTSPENLAGLTLITLLFEPQLGYEFVLSSVQTQGQIWAFMPQAIGNALGISDTDVKALWMKPYAPVGYNGDPSSLMTIYNTYIPSGSVDSMSHQIQTPQSRYFSASKGVPGQLANFTVSGFPLLYVSDPYTSSSNGGDKNGNSAVSSDSAASNRRRDAIIAVCTIIGSIALIVLGWWAYKNYKRRQEGAHQRLADPLGLDRGGYGATDDMMRERPPSVGPDGIRRNSFYFAEDSLRGYRNQLRDMEEEAQLASTSGGRRHVQGAAISTPILRDNTLNW